LGLQGFLEWPTHTAKWPSKSLPPSAAAPGSVAAAAVQAWPPSMFFVERSLGPRGRALQSQLMQTRVELMDRRAALLRDRGLRDQVPCGFLFVSFFFFFFFKFFFTSKNFVVAILFHLLLYFYFLLLALIVFISSSFVNVFLSNKRKPCLRYFFLKLLCAVNMNHYLPKVCVVGTASVLSFVAAAVAAIALSNSFDVFYYNLCLVSRGRKRHKRT
jgi:hypothetical protein